MGDKSVSHSVLLYTPSVTGRRLKVAFISEPWDTVDPPPANWSGPILTYEIAKLLARSCDVIVYSHKLSHLPKTKTFESVEYRYIPLFNDRRGAYRLTHLPLISSAIDTFKKKAYPDIHRPSYAADFAFWTYVLSISEDLRSRKCDVIHIHQFSQFVPIIRWLNPQAKIVLHMHTDWLNQFDPKWIEPRLNKCDLILGCSNFIAKNIRKRFPDLASRCDFLHNGADIEHFSGGSTPDGNGKRLLFVGRLSPEKGVHILLDAFHKVLQKHPETELLLAGPWRSASKRFIDFSDDPLVTALGPFFEMDYLSHLKSKVTGDATDRVHFLGPVEHRGLIDLYRSADALVVSSVWNEPFGMPVVEAMASECAVVATRAGGIVEIIEHEKSGLLVDRGNADTLADALIRILDDSKFRADLVRAGRERAVECFSWDKIVNDLLQKYSTLL
jgi:glycosyltransferase involved in cell wall biosynthesis